MIENLKPDNLQVIALPLPSAAIAESLLSYGHPLLRG